MLDCGFLRILRIRSIFYSPQYDCYCKGRTQCQRSSLETYLTLHRKWSFATGSSPVVFRSNRPRSSTIVRQANRVDSALSRLTIKWTSKPQSPYSTGVEWMGAYLQSTKPHRCIRGRNTSL